MTNSINLKELSVIDLVLGIIYFKGEGSCFREEALCYALRKAGKHDFPELGKIFDGIGERRIEGRSETLDQILLTADTFQVLAQTSDFQFRYLNYGMGRRVREEMKKTYNKDIICDLRLVADKVWVYARGYGFGAQ